MVVTDMMHSVPIPSFILVASKSPRHATSQPLTPIPTQCTSTSLIAPRSKTQLSWEAGQGICLLDAMLG